MRNAILRCESELMNQILETMVTLDAAGIHNRALKSPLLPPRLQLLKWGANDTTKGVYTVNQTTEKVLAANQRALGFERVAVDFNHCSVPGSPDYEALLKLGQPPIIFGYGRPAVVAGEGLFLEDMEWTPLGVQSARNFEDLSPALHDEKGEVTFLHSVALTPNGCTHGLTFFSAGSVRVGPLRGRNRLIAALEGEHAARGIVAYASRPDRPVQMLAAASGRETAPERKSEAEIRREITRKALDGWNDEQKRRPGPRSPVEFQQFRDGIEAAVAKALLVCLLALAPLCGRGDSFQMTNQVANGVTFNGWPTNAAGLATGRLISVQAVREAGFWFSGGTVVQAGYSNQTGNVIIDLVRSWAETSPAQVASTNYIGAPNCSTRLDWETTPFVTLTVPYTATNQAIYWGTNLSPELLASANFIGIKSVTNTCAWMLVTNTDAGLSIRPPVVGHAL